MRRQLIVVVIICLLAAIWPPEQALATCNTRQRKCEVSTRKQPTPPKGPHPKPAGKPTKTPTPPETARQKKVLDQWLRADKAYRQCWSEAALQMKPAASCGPAPQRPTFLPGWAARMTTLTPGEAGAIAAAQLQLPMTAPGIGPSPDLNEWKMAAVGYPLWLWLDGPTHVGPVRVSVGGLSVSLDARVSDLSFQMGDRHVVHCIGTGRRWTNSVPTSAKSPACGYAYQKPSLPQGSYTVTAIATWSVRWTVNGQSGVITMPIAGSSQLPVGELQVLVR